MPRKSSDLGGIISMLAATGAFVVGDTYMKIVIEDLPPFEVLFLRGIAASFACAILVTLRAEWGAIFGLINLRTLLRAAGETLTTLCYVVALACMPIADVIAIIQTAPIILILGAAIFLREMIGPARLALALLGFAGALMVVQPGAGGVSSAAMLRFCGRSIGRRSWSHRASGAHPHEMRNTWRWISTSFSWDSRRPSMPARGSLRTESQYSAGSAASGAGVGVPGLCAATAASFSICLGVGIRQLAGRSIIP